MDITRLKTDIENALGGVPLTELNDTTFLKNTTFECGVTDANGGTTTYVFHFATRNGATQGTVRAGDHHELAKLYEDCLKTNAKYFIMFSDNSKHKLGDDVYVFAGMRGDKTDIYHNQTYTFDTDKSNNPLINSAIQNQRPYTALSKKSSHDRYITYVPAKDASGAATTEILKQYLFSYDSRPNSNYVINIQLPVVGATSNATAGTGWPCNFIIAGAPGTGKSYTLEDQVKKEIATDYAAYCKINGITPNYNNNNGTIIVPKNYWDAHVRRVTFYEDYSYENFVGCYKPQPDDHEIDITTDKITTSSSTTVNGVTGTLSSTEITYKYQPGPFIDTYVEAKKNSKKNSGKNWEEKYFLIIEEINRARAASVFGDIFQLLDRDSSGESTYSITPEPDLADYLSSQGLTGEMRIPSNMYIWATMNNADQGVNPLDSAFKRRWGYLYMGIDSVNDIHPKKSKFVTNSGGPVLCIGSDANGLKGVNWNKFRTALNERLLANGVSEDKCIGPYYFSGKEFLQIENYYMKNKNKRIHMVNPLRDKLLLYLFTDVCRNNPGLLFNDNIKSMHDIRNEVN